jgi:hypothetical protein
MLRPRGRVACLRTVAASSHVGFARPTGDRTEFGHNCVISARKPALRGGNARTSGSVGEHRHRFVFRKSIRAGSIERSGRIRCGSRAARVRERAARRSNGILAQAARHPRSSVRRTGTASPHRRGVARARRVRCERRPESPRQRTSRCCRARLRARKPSCPRDLALTLWTMKSGARSGRVWHRLSLVRRPSSGSALVLTITTFLEVRFESDTAERRAKVSVRLAVKPPKSRQAAFGQDRSFGFAPKSVREGDIAIA